MVSIFSSVLFVLLIVVALPSAVVKACHRMEAAVFCHGATSGPVEGMGYLFPTWDPPEIQFGHADARHNGTINVGWADGHGSSVKIRNREDPYQPDELTSVPDSPRDKLWDTK